MGGGKPPSRWWYLVGLLVVVGGFAVALWVGLQALSGRIESFDRVVVPGNANLDLRAARYTIYYEARSFVDGKVYATGAVSGLACQLTDPAGAPVQLTTSAVSSSYGFGRYSGESVFQFRADRMGRYSLACDYGDQAGGQPVVLAVGTGVFGSILGAVLVGLGSIIVGTLILVVAFVRRRPPPPRPAGPPAWGTPAWGPPAPGIGSGGQAPAQPLESPPPQPAGPPTEPTRPPPPYGDGVASDRYRPPTGPYPRTEGLAIAALILAVAAFLVPILPAIVALILTVAAAARIRASSGALSGRGLVIAARVVAVVALVVPFGILLVLASDGWFEERFSRPASSVPAVSVGLATTPATTEPPQEVAFNDLGVGDCFQLPQGNEGATVDAVPCGQSHDVEVFAVVQLREQTLPAENELERIAKGACAARFGGYVGVPPRDSKLDFIAFSPTKQSWAAGDRTVVCALGMPNGPRLVGSMRGARR